ncbi:MAG: flagellar hook-basal body complex protein [Cohaesibacteraceae bacterium]|nr:flagellar hook-basal body complex protein [Cohaesibacteraceae bacterium]
MGIFAAMASAVSGLRAQSTALENISGNIANSQTIGYKRLDSTFADLVSNSGGDVRSQKSGSVLHYSRQTNTVQGDVQSSSIGTHMAVNGDGYFIVSKKVGEVDGRPIFDGRDFYTRRGDFEVDRNGYLVNGSGYYIKTLPLDQITGNPVGSVPVVTEFKNDFLPAVATTQIEYRANLADYPITQTADPDVANSELLAISGGWAAGNDVTYAQTSEFIAESISGGSRTTYDANGSPVNVQFRWGKTSNTAGAETWRLFYLQDSTTTTAGDTVWKDVGTAYVYSAAGKLTSASTVTVTALTVNGVNIGNISMVHGSDGLTQYADANGVAKVNRFTQNGSAPGELKSIEIAEGGKVVANYSNGKTIGIANIPLSSFNGDNYLRRMDGGAFAETAESGAPALNATGTIVGKATEASNTDIADEFSKMIITQQAYSANTRIVTTAQEMLREALSIVR